MSILHEIFAHKRTEVAVAKQRVPESELEKQALSTPFSPDFIHALTDSARSAPRLIAEVKHRSPSKGILCPDFDPLRLSRVYGGKGGSADSVLTDEKYFGGRLDYLRGIGEMFRAEIYGQERRGSPNRKLGNPPATEQRRINPAEGGRFVGSDDFSRYAGTTEVVTTMDGPRSSAVVRVPLLRKDFVFDRYQLLEARAAGASAVLLIAAMLEQDTLCQLIAEARSLSLTPLVEIHTRAELDRALDAGADVVGINNRDLHTFKVSLQTTLDLRPHIPPGVVVVAESGIKTREDVRVLAEAGVDAMLIGEGLVTAEDVGGRVREFSREILPVS